MPTNWRVERTAYRRRSAVRSAHMIMDGVPLSERHLRASA